uniref:Uncharacterized protein n=1 Tax=uncultured marine microorganism HF4000_APKG7H23 TaxID=455551 RepID=B3T9U3_9ZZZZ|nr:hypothetical protein ALOHA_HF4000APKG7H23ctg3g17 [uncultured marine microorganism HF4000_APKG7H23]
MPAYSASTALTGISPGRPRVTMAQRGTAPMAATSLRLEAIAFHPTSDQEAVEGVKCTPSTMVSVVLTSTPASVYQAAASSPIPSTSRKPPASGI